MEILITVMYQIDLCRPESRQLTFMRRWKAFTSKVFEFKLILMKYIGLSIEYLIVMKYSISFSKIIQFLIKFLFFIAICSKTYARVNYDYSRPLVLPSLDGLNSQSDPFGPSAVKDIIPQSSTLHSNESLFASQIADNSIRYFWNNSGFKNTTLGQVAEKVENTVKFEKTIADEKKVKHQFSFDINGVQALARFKYSGWVKALLSYNAKEAQAAAEISEKVLTDKDLILSQSVGALGSVSQVSLRWDW